MVCVASKPMWILAAVAVMAAQAVAPAFGRSCDRPCCHARVSDGDTATTVFSGEPSGGCPLCLPPTTGGDRCPVNPSDVPCHCQLDARQDLPTSLPKGDVSRFELAAEATLPTAAVPSPPRAIGVSREYLATALAIPIRPARILFGVWRD